MPAAVTAKTDALLATGAPQGKGKGKGGQGGFTALLQALFKSGGPEKAKGPHVDALLGEVKGQEKAPLQKSGKHSVKEKFNGLVGAEPKEASKAKKDSLAETPSPEALPFMVALNNPSPALKMGEGSLLKGETPTRVKGGAPAMPGLEMPDVDGVEVTGVKMAASKGVKPQPQEIGKETFANLMRGKVEAPQPDAMGQPAVEAPLKKAAPKASAKAGMPGAAKAEAGVATPQMQPLHAGMPAAAKLQGKEAKSSSAREAGPKAEALAPTQPRPQANTAAAEKIAFAPAMPEELETIQKSLGTHSVDDSPKTGLTKRLALQVGRQISTSLKQNQNEVVFQVRPPSLGRLEMRIEKEGETLSVRIISEKEKAGELLASGKGEIRALLSEHGIRVDRIEVEQGGSMQFAQQGGGDARDGRQRFNGPDGDQAAPHGGTDAPEAPPDETRRHDGSISVTA